MNLKEKIEFADNMKNLERLVSGLIKEVEQLRETVGEMRLNQMPEVTKEDKELAAVQVEMDQKPKRKRSNGTGWLKKGLQ